MSRKRDTVHIKIPNPKPGEADYVVSLMGKVHLPTCASRGGMTWPWEGRNNLAGDEACPKCLPDGLPDREPYRFSDEELASLRALAGMDPS